MISLPGFPNRACCLSSWKESSQEQTWCDMSLLMFIAILPVCLVFGLQIFWTRQFLREFTRKQPAGRRRSKRSVAVILPLRGADPSLRECLNGLMNQRHQPFTLHVVLDGDRDPSSVVVDEVRSAHPAAPIRVYVLHHPLPTCGLKVSALTQAIQNIDESVEIVVIVDADARPDPNWLSDLVEPFDDPSVGATCGVRWYRPAVNSFVNIARRQWNCDVIVQMHAFEVPWGGSLAIRREVACHANNLRRWNRSLCDDAPLAATLNELGLRLRVLPQLVLVNDESTDLVDCFQFIRRQILLALLHHPSRRGMLLFGIGKISWPVILISMLLMNLDNPLCVITMLATLTIAYVTQLKLTNATTFAVLNALSERTGVQNPYRICPKSIVAGFLTMPFVAATFVSALCVRQIRWRGITYELRGPSSIRMQQYLPYRPNDFATPSSAKSIV